MYKEDYCQDLVAGATGTGCLLGAIPGTLIGCSFACTGGWAIAITSCLVFPVDGIVAANVLAGVGVGCYETASCLAAHCQKEDSSLPPPQQAMEADRSDRGESKESAPSA